MKVVKHLLKCYFKHIFIILFASKRQTYRFKSSLHVFLFRNRVNRTRPKFRDVLSSIKDNLVSLVLVVAEHH